MRKRAISIISLKGGVGKTTTASNIAYLLAHHYNHKALIIDSNLSAPGVGIHFGIANPQKGRTTHDIIKDHQKIPHAIHKYDRLHVIPAALNNEAVNPTHLSTAIQKIKQYYDIIIIDSAPSFSYEFVSSLKSADSCIIVTTPDYSSITNVLQTIKLADKSGAHILGIIINKRSRYKKELSLEQIASITGKRILGTVRTDKNMIKALSETMPLAKYKPKSKASKDLHKIAELLAKIH
jgi:MinD-like ATPase involved in chromosome partitioning or flagellar assembly